jgi:hypothetical protein
MQPEAPMMNDTATARPPRANYKPNNVASQQKINLSPADHRKIDDITKAYMDAFGVTPSYSLVYAMGLDALQKEVRNGHLRHHPDLYISAASHRRRR